MSDKYDGWNRNVGYLESYVQLVVVIFTNVFNCEKWNAGLGQIHHKSGIS